MNKTTNSLMRTLIRFVFIYSLLLVTLNTAFAQYPNKPITIVVPYEVGGGVDQVARLVAIKLSAKLKQTVLIENRSGASNTIGMSYVAKAKADGYTIGFITATFLMTPFSMEKHPYQPLTDFVPIAMIGSLPMILAVNGNLPVNNLLEFINYAKAHPGQLNWVSLGSTSSQGLAGLEFNQAVKIEATQIQYKGSASGLKDLIAGTVQYLFNPLPSLIQHAENNSIKILGTGGNKPLKDYPQIPLINQTVPGYSAQNWYGVVAPVNTSSSVVQKLNQTINDILAESEMQSHLNGLGVQVIKLSPSEFAKWMRLESVKDEQIFKTLKL